MLAQTLAMPEEKVLSFQEFILTSPPWQEELRTILYELPPPKLEQFLRIIFGEEGNKEVEIIANDSAKLVGKIISPGFLSTSIWFHFYREDKPLLASAVDELRGATSINRAHMGLLVTLGKVTSEAQRQAENSRSPVIELLDGERLIQRLQELGLGIHSEIVRVERVLINRTFFDTL